MKLAFRLPWPPSVNTYWRKSEFGMYLTKRGRLFREAAIAEIWQHATAKHVSPIEDRLRVTIELTPPTRRRLDIDNHCKAVLDAIEHSGLIADDEQVDVLLVRRLPVCSPGCADVSLEVLG